MAKLNQIIAVEKGIKSKVYSDLTDMNKLIQKGGLFNGLVKKYEKKDEEGEDLPSEKQKVQYTVDEVLRNVERSLSELMTVTARKDFTNTEAKADVKVGDKVLVAGAPVSFLLFLEKTLTDVRTFVGNLPILDESENWTFDDKAGLFVTDVVKTHRTKKTQKPIVLYPATVEHPAQTQLITEDVIAGFWAQVKQSGAIPKTRKAEIAEKVEVLLRAVKEAREAANVQEEAKSPEVGAVVFDFILGK
jgi:hypothetical protein